MIPVGGGNSSPMYGDTKRVGRFTLEERRQLLQRFQQKRAQRNFNKKIKVDLLHVALVGVGERKFGFVYGTDQPDLSFSEVISHVVASQGRPCPNNARVEQAERHLDAL